MKIKFLCFFASLLLCFSSQHSAVKSEEIARKQTKQKVEDKKGDSQQSETKKEPINESDFHPVLLGALLERPSEYVGKKIKFRGKFSSFTTLALDYEPALRKSKNYIALSIFRPDSKIPLSELKLAYPLKEAKEDQVIRELEEGDLLEINGQVFSAALDEPWVDILSLKLIDSMAKKDASKIAEEKAEDKTLKGSTKNKKKEEAR